MPLINLFYLVRPLIPRTLQIRIRRRMAAYKRRKERDVWPIDHAAGRAPTGWKGWPDGKRFALVLNHDVDTAKGHDKCGALADLEKRLGFRSTFYFVPEGYPVSLELRRRLREDAFEVGVHGLFHDGKMFSSRRTFEKRAVRINSYLKDWGTGGFSSPSMHRNMDWMSDLDIEYGISTFDTDPFEPQPQGVRRIYPFWYQSSPERRGYVEMPYTLPQDHTLFVILKERDIRIWRDKLDWIVERGGMALLNSHPDYMRFDGGARSLEEYPAELYAEFLLYVKDRYADQYWQPLASEMARFWKGTNLKDIPSL